MLDKIINQGIGENLLKYLKNTSWLLFEKVIRIISMIFIGAWMARYLGPEKYGILAYGKSIVAFFIPLAVMGLNDIVVKELVRAESNSKERILGTTFTIKFFSGLSAFILLVLITWLLNEDSRTFMLILILSLQLFLNSFDILDLYFQSKLDAKSAVYSRLVGLVVSNTTIVILILIQAELVLFAVVIVMELLLTKSVYILRYSFIKQKKMSAWAFDKKLACTYLKQSWPLFLSGVMFVFYLRIDQVMVKQILGSTASGVYAVAINLSEVWYFIPQIIAVSFFPAIVRSKALGEKIYYARLTKLFFVLFWIAVGIGVFMTIFGNWIIYHLYGDLYNESFYILKLYIWSNVFFFFTTLSSKWLITENLYRHALYRNLIGAVMNVILNLILLHNFGLAGAAIATLISYSVVGLFYDLLNVKLRKMFILKLKSIICLT